MIGRLAILGRHPIGRVVGKGKVNFSLEGLWGRNIAESVT